MLKSKILHSNYLLILMTIIPLGLIFGPLIPEIILFLIIVYITFKKNELVNVFKFFKKSFYLFIIFYLLIIVSSILSFEPSEPLLKSISYIRFLFLVLSGYFIFQSQKNINFFSIFLIILFTILFLDTNLQYWFGSNIIGYEYNFNRASSFFNDELIMGSYTARIFPIILALIFFSTLNNKKYYIYYVSFISFVLIFLSSERTAFFLFILTVITLSFLKNYRFNFIIFLVAIIFGISSGKINNERLIEHTINQFYDKEQKKLFIFSERHQNHYSTAWKIFLDYKIFGAGIKSFRKLCDLEKYSKHIIQVQKLKSENITSPVDGKALIIQEKVSKYYFLFIFKKEIPPEINYQINISSFMPFFDYSESKKNYLFAQKKNTPTSIKNLEYTQLIPLQLDLLQQSIRKEFLFFKIKHLNSFDVTKGEILAKIPKDQFVNGCNTHPHNTYIQLLSETGIFSFLIVLFIFILVSVNILKFLLKSLTKNEEYYYGLLMLNICFFINLFPFVPTGSFYNNFLSFIYFLPVGIYYALIKNDISK